MSTTSSSAPASLSALMVFPWCLDRIGHGNIQRFLAMATYLSRHGVTVDLVYQGNPGVPSREHELTMFRRVIRVSGWKSRDDARILDEWDAFYGENEPPSSNLSPGTALTAVVRGVMDAIEYSAVISTYAWTAPIFDGVAPGVLRIVDLQDIISKHGARSEKVTGRVSSFSMAEDTERFLWRHWDVLLAITHDEARAIAPALQPTQRLLTVLHSVSLGELDQPETDAVVYTGSDNPSNQAAVSWLLTEVWPRVLSVRPEAQLRLVGLICDAVKTTPLASTPNVELVGFVERPLDEVASASVCVAPYLYGSGLKIKVVEAAATGRPLVTTTTGAEGSGLADGVHALITDDAAQFASAIVRLLGNGSLRTSLAEAARTHARQTFSEDACYAPLLQAMRSHVAPPVRHDVVSSAAERRLRQAVSALDAPPVVIWGNGSHTRALIALLEQLEMHVRCVVDKHATHGGTSPEGLKIAPAKDFRPGQRDLIVLSSQVHEPEMWEDLAVARACGAHVLALYHRHLTTDALKRALRQQTTGTQVRLGPRNVAAISHGVAV